MNEETVAKARGIIEANRYMTLATADGGDPWVAPVAYVVDYKYDFYWASRRDARHSCHIERTGVAAIAIFDSTAGHSDVDGVQAEGRAEAVSDEQVPELWELYLTRYPMYRSYSSEVMMSTSPIGLYRFTPNALYKLDSASTDGDRRLAIDIAALLARLPA